MDQIAYPFGSLVFRVTLAVTTVLSGVAGLGIGFVWEWFREAKHRAAASQHRREAGRLKQEVNRLKSDQRGPADEVLALLDGKGSTS